MGPHGEGEKISIPGGGGSNPRAPEQITVAANKDVSEGLTSKVWQSVSQSITVSSE